MVSIEEAMRRLDEIDKRKVAETKANSPADEPFDGPIGWEYLEGEIERRIKDNGGNYSDAEYDRWEKIILKEWREGKGTAAQKLYADSV